MNMDINDIKINDIKNIKDIKIEETGAMGTWDAFLVYLDEDGKQMIVHYYSQPVCYAKNKYFEVKMSDKYKFHVNYEDIVLLIIDHKVLVDNSKRKEK